MHSRVDDMVKHVSHLCKIGGRDVLAIGTDYDGIGGSLELDHYPRLSLLWDALISAGMTTLQLEHMWYENANRVLSAEL